MYRYREVYSLIKKDILTNHYRAGSLMPTQETLANKYGVSRLTLKKSLAMLREEGLIYSKQGSGTYVRPQMSESAEELLPLDMPVGVTYSHRSRKITSEVRHFDARLPDDKEQKSLKIERNEPVYEIKRVRFIDGQRYSFEHTIMPTSIAPLDEQIVGGSIYDYLGSKINLQLADARRVVFAEAADEETAAALQIKPGAPVLAIEQIAYDQRGRAFEYSLSRFIDSQSRFVLDVHRQMPWEPPLA